MIRDRRPRRLDPVSVLDEVAADPACGFVESLLREGQVQSGQRPHDLSGEEGRPGVARSRFDVDVGADAAVVVHDVRERVAERDQQFVEVGPIRRGATFVERGDQEAGRAAPGSSCRRRTAGPIGVSRIRVAT